MLHLYIPSKPTFGFLAFSGGIEKEGWVKMGETCLPALVFSTDTLIVLKDSLPIL